MRYISPVIQPAVMADEWELLMADIRKVPSATHIQVDIMDGALVPSKSFPYNNTGFEGRYLPDNINFEAHVMVKDPLAVGIAALQSGCSRITAQLEGFTGNILNSITKWREAGAQEVGISILLDTPTEALDDIIQHIDSVQVMSIASIGYQGHDFDERALIRIKELRARFRDVTIAVDGGIKAENIQDVVSAGADVIGIGSAIMHTDDPDKAYTHLCSLTKT